MGDDGVIRVVSGFGNKKAAVGGGRITATVTNGMAVPGPMEVVPIIRRIALGGRCRVRTDAVAITDVFRPSGAIAVSMV